MSSNITISSQDFPDETASEMKFPASSFFRRHGPNQDFPTPAEVRALSDPLNPCDPAPVIFENLGLLVKFGNNVKTSEAQCLWLIKKVLGEALPVPEVYGWQIDGDHVFIYMELIRGETLTARWHTLTTLDKSNICAQLKIFITNLRLIKQDPNDQFIGAVDHGAVRDSCFVCLPQGGPFPNIKSFHDWLCWLPGRNAPNAQIFFDYYRPHLPDTGEITFTHADLHRGNILVSVDDPPRIVAIVDWGNSGWYPGYWEYLKACWTSGPEEEWRIQCIPSFLDTYPETFVAMVDILSAMGAE